MPIEAELVFARKSHEKPKYIMQPMGQPATRIGEFHSQTVAIHDARDRKLPATLDTSGFQLVRHSISLDPELRDDMVTCADFNEVETFLKGTLNAGQVTIFDHTVRSSSPDPSSRGTAAHVHNDYTQASFHQKLSTLKVQTQGRRVAQINMWMPLAEPVVSSPLAVLDGSSLVLEDLISCDLEYPDRVGEIYELAHNPNQSWFYYPEMRRNEALLIKGYDSMSDGRVRYAPHSAFIHPDEGPNPAVRRSIEFRTVAVY